MSLEIDPSKIIFACCHIKRSLFFEESMKKLWDAGFHRIWIQQTGTDTFGPYQGPCEYYWPAPHAGPCLWETGLKCFHKNTDQREDWEYLFLCDFDLFFLDTKELIQFINETIEGSYDHVSRFKDRNDQSKYDFKNKLITHVPEIIIHPGDVEHDWPSPTPHFATGYEIFSKSLWNSYTDYDLGDGRRMYREAVLRGFKMGVQYSNYGSGEQCWGDEWFHVSNLTAFYHMVDGSQRIDVVADRQDHLFRIGFFAAQEEYYGPDIYSNQIKNNLSQIYQLMGGKDKCLAAWHKEIEGKPMQDWMKQEEQQ